MRTKEELKKIKEAVGTLKKIKENGASELENKDLEQISGGFEEEEYPYTEPIPCPRCGNSTGTCIIWINPSDGTRSDPICSHCGLGNPGEIPPN